MPHLPSEGEPRALTPAPSPPPPGRPHRGPDQPRRHGRARPAGPGRGHPLRRPRPGPPERQLAEPRLPQGDARRRHQLPARRAGPGRHGLRPLRPDRRRTGRLLGRQPGGRRPALDPVAEPHRRLRPLRLRRLRQGGRRERGHRRPRGDRHPEGLRHLPRPGRPVRRPQRLVHRPCLSAEDHRRGRPDRLLRLPGQLRHLRRPAEGQGRLPRRRPAAAARRPGRRPHRPRRQHHHPQAARTPARHQHVRRRRLPRHPLQGPGAAGLQAPAAVRPVQGRRPHRDLAGGRAAALEHRRPAAEPGARRRRAVLRRRRAERQLLAPRPDRPRRQQLQLERGRLQQLPAVLRLQRRLRRLPQHLRPGDLRLRLAGAHRAAGTTPGRLLLHR